MTRTTPGNYVPLDVNYARDAAIRNAGEAAELLFVRGLAYCKSARSDGFVPDYDLPVVAVGMKGVPKRVTALVANGLWRPVQGGWIVRSWDKWNKPAAVEQAFVASQAEHGNKGNHKRWHADRGVVDPECPYCPDPNRKPDRKPDGVADRKPDRQPESPIREGKGSTEAKASARPIANPTENSGKIIKAWIDGLRRRPADRVVGQVAKTVGQLLAEDFTSEQILAGLAEMDAKGLNPATLPSLVSNVANGSVTAIRSNGRPAYATTHRADGQIPHWER